jgi:hypothetical protein
VSVDNVDILEAETLQRGLESFNNVLAGQTVVVDENLTVHGTIVDLWNIN